MTVDDIFGQFLTGTDDDKAKVREFILRHENLHLLHSAEFTAAAVRNADALGIQRPTDDYDYGYDAEPCPHCGRH